MEIIGKAQYGETQLVKNKQNNRYYTIKTLRKEEIIRMKQVDHIISELTI